MDVWRLLDLVIKFLPYIIKLVKFIAKRAKDKRRPRNKGQATFD